MTSHGLNSRHRSRAELPIVGPDRAFLALYRLGQKCLYNSRDYYDEEEKKPRKPQTPFQIERASCTHRTRSSGSFFLAHYLFIGGGFIEFPLGFRCLINRQIDVIHARLR